MSSVSMEGQVPANRFKTLKVLVSMELVTVCRGMESFMIGILKVLRVVKTNEQELDYFH